MLISRRRFAASMAGVAGGVGRLCALPPRPKLFVIIVSEQFRQDYLERVAPRLGVAGLRRMIAQGAYFPNCRLAATGFSACGLATLATGAYPQVHGIVADRWYDRRSGMPVKARSDMLEASVLADAI